MDARCIAPDPDDDDGDDPVFAFDFGRVPEDHSFRFSNPRFQISKQTKMFLAIYVFFRFCRDFMLLHQSYGQIDTFNV